MTNLFLHYNFIANLRGGGIAAGASVIKIQVTNENLFKQQNESQVYTNK
jgi:hypothetical protein